MCVIVVRIPICLALIYGLICVFFCVPMSTMKISGAYLKVRLAKRNQNAMRVCFGHNLCNVVEVKGVVERLW